MNLADVRAEMRVIGCLLANDSNFAEEALRGMSTPGADPDLIQLVRSVWAGHAGTTLLPIEGQLSHGSEAVPSIRGANAALDVSRNGVTGVGMGRLTGFASPVVGTPASLRGAVTRLETAIDRLPA